MGQPVERERREEERRCGQRRPGVRSAFQTNNAKRETHDKPRETAKQRKPNNVNRNKTFCFGLRRVCEVPGLCQLSGVGVEGLGVGG